MVALKMDSLGEVCPNKKTMVDQSSTAKPRASGNAQPHHGHRSSSIAKENELDDLTPQQRLQLEESRWRLHSTLSVAQPHQCANVLLQRIDAPVSAVWPMLRRFDMPQAYKRFVKACVIASGDGSSVGSLRNITLVSGLPASCSTERLEILDDEHHIVSFRVVGGEHRLRNYASVTSLHEFEVSGSDANGGGGNASTRKIVTVVMESYVVDVPEGNTKEDTCLFTDTVVRCNLQSLAKICQADSRRRCQQQQQDQAARKQQQQLHLQSQGADNGLILMR